MVEGPRLALQTVWTTSKPEWLSQVGDSFAFNGFELTKTSTGYKVHEEGYCKELLSKWEDVEGECRIPISKEFSVPETPAEERAALTKQAQTMCGQLLWLSGRTRPDLAFAVTKACQVVASNPAEAVARCKCIVKYLRYAPSVGLHYGPAPNDFGQWAQLKYKRDAGSLEVYSDASYGADFDEECKGMQSAHVYWGGALVMWGQCRQPLAPTSTAEAELIALAEAHLMGKAMSPAIEALLEGITSSPPNRILYCDNSAAAQICLYDTGSWRTRHLRRRSASIHYDVEASEWKLSHLEGVFMTADIGTKALGPSRFEDLLQALELCTPHRESRAEAEVGSQPAKPEPTWVTKVLLALALLCQVQAASAQTATTSDLPSVTGGNLFRMCVWISLAGLLLGFCGFLGWSLGRLVPGWFRPRPPVQSRELSLPHPARAPQGEARPSGFISFNGRNPPRPTRIELAERYRSRSAPRGLHPGAERGHCLFPGHGHLQYRYPTVPTPGWGRNAH